MSKSKEIVYPAVFSKNNGIFTAEFPDLPGCFVQGEQNEPLDKVFLKAQKALAIYSKEKNELPMIDYSYYDRIQNNDRQNCITQLVSVNTENYIVKEMDLVKKTLTIPKWVDNLAKKYDINFSHLLKEAIIYNLSNSDEVSSYDKKILND